MTPRFTHPERPAGRSETAHGLRDGRVHGLRIWTLAFGYLLFYAPYAALTKATSTGLLPRVSAPASPFEMLPAIGFATAVVVTIVVTTLGWWRYCSFASVGRWRVPRPTRRTLIAGLATAAIIYATTLMFTFNGMSIVLALLIMRGGVLVLSPLLDLVFRRRVRWFAWTALALALAAVVVSAMLVNSQLHWMLAATAGTYLAGYIVRLHCANAEAKSEGSEDARRYFVEEQLVAMTALVAAPLGVALLGDTTLASHIRYGLTTFLTTAAVLPALAIGVLYAGLYCYGTLIYLDRRENTFCVTLNRSASLLGGLLAALALNAFAGTRPPDAHELFGASLILLALVVLSPAHHALEALAAWRRSPSPLVAAHAPAAPLDRNSEWP
jgi:hypothetical protein